jgi:hypothetical protein
MLARFLLTETPMKNRVKVSFRGIEPEGELVLSAQGWATVIHDGLASCRSVDMSVFIDRHALHWGGSTTVRVDVVVDGKQFSELESSQDPHEALDGSFTAVAKRLRRIRASATGESMDLESMFPNPWHHHGLGPTDSTF